MGLKDVHVSTDRMENNVDPDQTAPRSSLILVCTVCSDLSVPILRFFVVR